MVEANRRKGELVCRVWTLRAQRRKLEFPKQREERTPLASGPSGSGLFEFCLFSFSLTPLTVFQGVIETDFWGLCETPGLAVFGNAGATLRVSLALCFLLFWFPPLTVCRPALCLRPLPWRNLDRACVFALGLVSCVSG